MSYAYSLCKYLQGEAWLKARWLQWEHSCCLRWVWNQIWGWGERQCSYRSPFSGTVVLAGAPQWGKRYCWATFLYQSHFLSQNLLQLIKSTSDVIPVTSALRNFQVKQERLSVMLLAALYGRRDWAVIVAVVAPEGCCHKYRTALGLLLEKACKATDGRSLPVLILLCVPSSLMRFPEWSWAVIVHISMKANRESILCYSTEKGENLALAVPLLAVLLGCM